MKNSTTYADTILLAGPELPDSLFVLMEDFLEESFKPCKKTRAASLNAPAYREKDRFSRSGSRARSSIWSMPASSSKRNEQECLWRLAPVHEILIAPGSPCKHSELPSAVWPGGSHRRCECCYRRFLAGRCGPCLCRSRQIREAALRSGHPLRSG